MLILQITTSHTQVTRDDCINCPGSFNLILHVFGGSLDSFVSDLGVHFHGSVVAGVYEPDTIPKFTCAGDLDAIAKKLRSVAPFQLTAYRQCIAVEPVRLPSYLANVHNHDGYMRKRSPGDLDRIKLAEGRLDGATKDGAALRCISLSSLHWDVPLAMNSMFKDFGLIIRASNCPSQDFLEALSRVVGARLIEKRSRRLMTFDPKAWRRHYAATIHEPGLTFQDGRIRSGAFLTASNELTEIAIDGVSDEFLIKCFENQTKYFDIACEPGSVLDAAARHRINVLIEDMSREPYKSSNVGENTRALLNLVDFDKPIKISFCAPMRIGVSMTNKEGGWILL